jgi:predicted permease
VTWRRAEEALDAELRFDFDQRVAEKIRAGMSEAEARRAARLEFGGLEQVKEECRDARGLRALQSILQDIRYALRGMHRSPGFTAVAIAILAVGLGINTAVFTIANAMLFSGYPHIDPDNRLLYLSSVKGKSLQGSGPSWPDVEDWNVQAKSFNGIGAVESGGLRLLLHDDSADSEVCNGTRLSDNSFRVLGQKPILGRDFAPSDGVPGAAPVAILNYAFWERRFSKDPNVIGKSFYFTGRSFEFDDKLVTVIGVMPPGFYFPHHWVDLWIPIVPTPRLQQRDRRSLYFAFGRLVKGATRKSAETEMALIGRRLESAYPGTNKDVHPQLRNFSERFAGPNAAALYGALWGAVGFVLLIACANLANLFLGRAIGRSREIFLRVALGAGRWRIIRQLLIESLMFGVPGGLLGWLIASVCARVYEQVGYRGGYQPFDFILDSRVFFYLAAISILSVLLFGLAPAIRLSKLDVSSAIKDGAHGATGGVSGKRFSALLVTVEIAVTVVLLAGAGLMARSFLKAYTEDTGVRAADILTASIGLPTTRYPAAESQIAFFDRLDARLKGIPGVAAVALADALPGLYAQRSAFELDGEPAGDERDRPTSFAVVIGPGYFVAVGAKVLSGRDFNDFDRASAPPVVLVSEQFAREQWPGASPLGKRLRLFEDKTPGAWRTVVGVTSNILQGGAGQISSASVMYVPYRQKPAPNMNMNMVALARVPPASLTAAVRHEIQTMDSDLVIGSGLGSLEGPAPLSASLAFQRYWSRGVNAGLYLTFAMIALLLAATGLYAVIAHSVARTTQEIGVRIAIGATSRDIRFLVLRQGLLPVSIGLGLGLVSSLGFNRLLGSQIFSVSPTDPSTYVMTSTVLISAALLACLIPANRAIRVDPAVALRHE